MSSNGLPTGHPDCPDDQGNQGNVACGFRHQGNHAEARKLFSDHPPNKSEAPSGTGLTQTGTDSASDVSGVMFVKGKNRALAQALLENLPASVNHCQLQW